MRRFKIIVGYIKPYWFPAALNILFNVLSAIFALFSFVMAIPFLKILFKTQELVTDAIPFALTIEAVQQNFDYFVSSIIIEYGEGKALMMVSVLVVIMVMLKTGFKFIGYYYIIPVRVGVIRDIRNKVYNKILRLPMSYFSDSRKGDVMARVGMDVNEIELSVMSSLEMIFRDPITIVVFLISLFLMSYQLTLFALILLPLTGLIVIIPSAYNSLISCFVIASFISAKLSLLK